MRNWLKRFAAVCAISLLPFSGATAQSPKPAIVMVDAADAPQWQKWAQELGWQVIVPTVPEGANIDVRAEAIAATVQAAIKDSAADKAHIYLAGRADAVAAVIYTISRVPDLWAGGLALGGSPKPAINSGRVYSANFTQTPVLWVSDASGDAELAAQLKSAGINLEWRLAKNLSIAQVFAALLQHSRAEYPPDIDCETNSTKFARCYWVEPTKFDVAERNEVLPPSRVMLGSGAGLDLGEFGYNPGDAGPGVRISVLPKDYSGPLKVDDRIVELDGKPIADAGHYIDQLNKLDTEKQTGIIVQRGKEKLRLDTRVILPRTDRVVTARVQGKYDAESKSIQIISRSVTELRVTIPAEWIPGDLYWNGVSLENLEKPGCYLLTIDQELLNAAPCAQ